MASRPAITIHNNLPVEAAGGRTAEAIDEEVHRVISESYDLSRDILSSRHADLERIARELMQKETLDRAALDQLIRTSTSETVPRELGQTL